MNNVLTIERDALEAALYLVEYEGRRLDEGDFRIDPDYPGAAARGRPCVGVYIPEGTRHEFFYWLSKAVGLDLATRLANKSRTEDLPCETLIYFVGVTLAGNKEAA